MASTTPNLDILSFNPSRQILVAIGSLLERGWEPPFTLSQVKEASGLDWKVFESGFRPLENSRAIEVDYNGKGKHLIYPVGY